MESALGATWRIGTWNLERSSGAKWTKQRQVLSALEYDVLVLTEPPGAVRELEPGQMVVTSPALRPRAKTSESWVAIVGMNVRPIDDLEIPFERMAAAATVQIGSTEVVVYASVLPWQTARVQAPEHALPGETALDMFRRMLAEQKADLVMLHQKFPDQIVLWAGDFNQTLVGPNYGGTTEKRSLLQGVLSELSFVAYNQSAPHASEGMAAIDLICGAETLTPNRIETIPAREADYTYSDHNGYIIEFSM